MEIVFLTYKLMIFLLISQRGTILIEPFSVTLLGKLSNFRIRIRSKIKKDPKDIEFVSVKYVSNIYIILTQLRQQMISLSIGSPNDIET